ncbi:MAG: alpha-1,2-fucosyltransferase [Myxococcales bacterium]|nr:alpha-1,2-fucosyltransferase [Myxococcales bacterium]
MNDRRFPLGVGASHKHCPFIFVDGYFQTGWTWPLLSEASSTLQVVDFPAAPSIAAAHDCIVHIRGGDFLGFESHSFIGTEYYSDAVDRAQACGCRTFGIVSDDYGYAEKLADALQDRHSEAKFSLIQDANDALVDFAILRHARNRIIGNSTFAWWAATLDHEAATTWSPDRFVRSKTRDFFLPHERTISLAGAENRATYIEHDDQTNPLH